MKKLSRITWVLFAVTACGSPALSETSTSTSVAHPSTGGEVHRTTTETHEVTADGAQTTQTTETTTTSTPPPR